MNEETCETLEKLHGCLTKELEVDVDFLSAQEEEILEAVRWQIVRIQREWKERKAKV